MSFQFNRLRLSHDSNLLSNHRFVLRDLRLPDRFSFRFRFFLKEGMVPFYFQGELGNDIYFHNIFNLLRDYRHHFLLFLFGVMVMIPRMWFATLDKGFSGIYHGPISRVTIIKCRGRNTIVVSRNVFGRFFTISIRVIYKFVRSGRVLLIRYRLTRQGPYLLTTTRYQGHFFSVNTKRRRTPRSATRVFFIRHKIGVPSFNRGTLIFKGITWFLIVVARVSVNTRLSSTFRG